MTMRSWVEVDTKALLHNVKTFKKLAPKSELMAVVKSNAYGHGLVGATQAFIRGGADWCAVDSLQEAILLRNADIRRPILVMGYVPSGDLHYLFEYKLRPVVYTMDVFIRLLALARRFSQRINVHLKIETGTNRQGILLHEVEKFAKAFLKNKLLVCEGITTHFANVEDETNQSFARLQATRLEEALAILRAHAIIPEFVHCAASAAVLVFPKSHYNLVRPGIGLYGLWPSSEIQKAFLRKKRVILKPALSFKTRVAQIKAVKKGSPIGYGLTERVRRDSRVAVLPVGYFDGYDRRLSSVGEVLIGRKRAKVLGRVCMNMIMVDVTNISGVIVEDVATLLGGYAKEHVSAEELAQKIGTINYEVIARINPLLPRLYI